MTQNDKHSAEMNPPSAGERPVMVEDTGSNRLTWMLHHDQLFHARVAFWVAAQSIGAAVVAASDMPRGAKIGAAVLGFVLTALWYVTGRNIAEKIVAFQERCVPFLDEWRKGGPQWDGEHKLMSSFNVLVIALPVTFWFVWVAVGVAAGFGLLTP